MPFTAQHIKAARLHLQKSDPVMRQIIKRVGPFTGKTSRNRFLTLVRSIIGQQISVAAARSILGRLETLVEPESISPTSLVGYSIDDLREAGISRQKAGYILDLASKVHNGTVDLKLMSRKDDETAIAELTQIKGIGVWTAQMFLMFSLGRMDVLPTDDLGLQNAIMAAYDVRGELTKQKFEKIAEAWRPHATIACWYLWQSLETP